MENRQDVIHNKGFDMNGSRFLYGGPGDVETRYNSIKVGLKTLDDASYELGTLGKEKVRNLADKGMILKALAEKDVDKLRDVSNYFYHTNGLYQKVCHYYAFLYRYDWYIEPNVKDESIKEKKLIEDFNKILDFCNASHIKQQCGEWALEVVRSGAFYGYIIPSNDKLIVQKLPNKYCRSRYKAGLRPAVEFNMKYFDDEFKDAAYRMKILGMFPKDFQKGYLLFKQGKLPTDTPGEKGSWYLLDPESAIKFSFYNNLYDIPIFINAIPAIIDLDQAQDLDRKKQMQKLLKILVQQLPRDKNGDLIFDVEEATDLHNNAVEMLKRAVGVDVLTTFADVQALDMSDKNTATSMDDLEKVERTVYNSLGISKNLFNTDGNLSLGKSINEDESTVRNLKQQFHMFWDDVVDKKNTQKKKYSYQFYMLDTTQYNYMDLAKMYKDQAQMGFSKMLPQIALGHTQSSILNTAYFENKYLKLHEIMIPNLLSSTMSAEQVLGKTEQDNSGNKQNTTEGKTTSAAAGKVQKDEGTTGRPEKSDDEKSEKTIQNRESMS